MLFWEDCGSVCLKLQVGKAIACSELRWLSCGSLEDENVERNTDDGAWFMAFQKEDYLVVYLN